MGSLVNCEVFEDISDIIALYNRIWDEVKAAQYDCKQCTSERLSVAERLPNGSLFKMLSFYNMFSGIGIFQGWSFSFLP